MALGDVTSNERGTGARYNDGKPDVSLIPLSLIAQGFLGACPGSDGLNLAKSLHSLGLFQTTGDKAHLNAAIRQVQFAWLDCARVFEYGKQKYAAWNWAKGMQWSAPLACAGRHALKYLREGEVNDDESTLPHIGHYLCNLVMLATFVESYPEGNDLPPATYFASRVVAPAAPRFIPDPPDPHFA